MQNKEPYNPPPREEGPLMRRLRQSARLQHLLRRVLIDGTLPLNPLTWLPVLLSGPRPPSGPGLRKAIRSWSRRRFRGAGCEIRVDEVHAPPPFLEAGGPGTGEGVALCLRCPDGHRVASLQAWLAADGSRGTYTIFDEGDPEIATHALEPFTDKGEAIGQLDRVAREFIGEHLLGRAFGDWLDAYSAAWRPTEPPASPDVAHHQDGEAWRYALLPHGESAIVLGHSEFNRTGSVEVGVFFADQQGVLVRQHHVGYAESPAALRTLLTKNFGKSPDDTVLAAWMLHPVVPPLQPAR
jgi:hypothetical protein